MKKIRKVKLFVNDNEKSRGVANLLEEKLLRAGILIDEDDFDLGVAIGGDGSFLRMIKENNFANCYYVGINAGTLGFAQEVNLNCIDDFIDAIINDRLNVEKIGVQEIEVHTRDSVSRLLALNELVVRDRWLNTIHFNIYVDNSLLEEYAGDGVLISTSFGSTAYNLSFGGSIVFNTFHTLQITPIAPLNSKIYRSLLNSIIIPSNNVIKLVPTDRQGGVILSVDGDNLIYDDIEYIETVIGKTVVNVIRMDNYNFVKKINDKFLK